MHLNSLTGTTERDVERRLHRDVHPQYIGEHQPGYGMREFERQRFYVSGAGGVPDVRGIEDNVWAGMGMPEPSFHARQVASMCPDARKN